MPGALVVLEIISGLLSLMKQAGETAAALHKEVETAKENGGVFSDEQIDRVRAHGRDLEDRLLSHLQETAGGSNDAGIPAEPQPPEVPVPAAADAPSTVGQPSTEAALVQAAAALQAAIASLAQKG